MNKIIQKTRILVEGYFQLVHLQEIRKVWMKFHPFTAVVNSLKIALTSLGLPNTFSGVFIEF